MNGSLSVLVSALMLWSSPAVAVLDQPAASGATQGVKNVILVHGAFADGSSWAKVIPLLQAKGLNVIAMQNPLSSLPMTLP
jgi:hypothetical protein